jgi:ribose/xylose/arabinose/galactoside ABC-type transport system permease subunit
MKESSMKRINDRIVGLILNNKALFILLILIVVAAFTSRGLFLTYNNFSSVSRQIAVTILLGLGFTTVLAAGGVDLSAGHMLSFVGVVYAILTLHLPFPVAILFALALGVLCGMFNGFVIQKFSLPPFILTLATAQIYKSFAYILSNGKSIGGMSDAVKFIGQGLIFGVIPISILIALVAGVIVAIILYRTKYGRHIIATGGNHKAANVVGINTNLVKISSYVVMGLFAALGAIVLTGRVSIATPGAGDGMEMDAIAAVVIGGTSMSGGKAHVGGTIFGCLVIGVIGNLLNLVNVSSFWQWFAKGLIIVLAIVMDSQAEKYFAKRRLRA